MVRSYVSVLNIPCICSRARVALLCDPIAWIADGCMPCYNFAYAALDFLVAWVSVRVYSWVRWEAWWWSLSVSEGDWLSLKISVTDFSASLAIDIWLLGILALWMLPKFVFPRKEWTSGSRRERSDDEQWLSTRVCRVIFNWFTYHASCMYKIG